MLIKSSSFIHSFIHSFSHWIDNVKDDLQQTGSDMQQQNVSTTGSIGKKFVRATRRRQPTGKDGRVKENSQFARYI